MTENEHNLTISDAAALLAVHPQTVRNWRKSKGLPAVKPGRDLRFSRRELLEWQDKQRPTPKPVAPEPTPEK